jgi:2-keto-4-pentenoate hydratase
MLANWAAALSSGNIIICGAPGQVHPAQTGKYNADFGPFGNIAFEIR